MTDEQWRSAWILCETAAEMDPEARKEYIRGATVDPEVGVQVLTVLEETASGPAFPTVPDRRSGDVIGRYVLQKRIGQGGMGQVYSAHDTELDRHVALKFLPPDLPLETSAPQIIREGRSASSLNHPNIVTVHEIMQTQWGLAIVMELVDGQSLRAMLKSGPLSRRQTVQIGRQIASALAAAHAKGIVHRDIKPENVIVRVDGFVKVLDFGLAQNIREGTVPGKLAHLPVGTVRYMSPEQKRGQEITGASDIYALAVVLEELGKWRHPLLTQMRSAVPEQRPAAEAVAARLERLERSTYRQVAIGLALLFVIVVAGFSSIQYWRKIHGSHEPRFEQITKRVTGHDVTVAGLSSDGKRLAFSTVDGGLFVRDTETSTVQDLDAPAGLSVSQLLFLSNASLLAVGSSRGSYESWTISLDGSAAARLRTNTYLVALSHDNQRIAWLNAEGEVWTGLLDGTRDRLVFRSRPGERIARIFWSASDRRLWFHMLQHCPSANPSKDTFVNPNFCEDSNLASYDADTGILKVELKNLRFTSGFFGADGEFFFLKQDVERSSSAFNLWSLSTDQKTDAVRGQPKQLSHLTGVVLSQLTGSSDGRAMTVVRTDCPMQTYVAEWKASPRPMLLNARRLTLEQTSSFPHAWTPDQQSVIFESDRRGRLELFQQKLTRTSAQLLATTTGDLYMPFVTPDGKWVLAMFRPTPAPGTRDDPGRHRLMRVPIAGGTAVEVPLDEPLDEFRCSLPGHGTRCVLRTTEGNEQRFFDLDPIRGKGRELGRTALTVTGLGGWDLAADGRSVTIPDRHRPGWFLEMRLDPDLARRTQRMVHIEGLDILSAISPLPSGKGWLASSGASDPYQLMEARSRTDGLYYVDVHLKPHLLYKSYVETYGVISPDERRMAFLGTELTSNVWIFQP